MNRKTQIINVILFAILLAAMFGDCVFAQVTAGEREKIQKAIPRKASAKPQKPRKLLVVNLNVRDGKVVKGHASIPCSNYAIELMGEKTGAYETVVSNDIEMFKPENIKQFDAVCFNNTVGVLFEDPQLKKSLLDFVYGGGGFIGIHAVAATFAQWPDYHFWPEFGEMLGGYEDGGHPWQAHETIAIKIDDPEHPVNAAFGRKGFEITDQAFQFRHGYSRDKLRVLVSIDTAKMDMSPSRRFLPERQKDKDFPFSWVKNYGRGRVFFTAFGHNAETFWNPLFLKHLLDGTQFALGDLPAPTTPSAKLTGAVRARETLDWRLGIGAYSFKEYSFDEAIEKTAALGLRYIEGGPDFNMGDDEVIALRRKLLDSDVRMVCYYVHKIPNDEQMVKKLFEFCRKLGVETITGEPEPEVLDLLEKYCDKYDINLAIHNHTKDISPFYYDPNNILKVLKGRSRRMGVCPDLGYWVRAGYDPVETLEKMKDRVITFHIHDVHEFSPQGHDVPWGAGVAKLDEFFKKAYELEINPTLWNIEYAYDFEDNTKQIAQSIKFFDKIIAPIVSYHRAYIGRTKGVRRQAGVSDEEQRKIENAIPAKAPATPKKPRRLLVFDKSVGHGKHPSVPHANYAVELMGERLGAYETVVTEDPAYFEADKLSEFDAVFFNNTVGDSFNSEELRQNLLDFVYRGGGVLGNHAASVGFAKQPGWTMDFAEYSKMLGTFGANHRESDETVTTKLDDPTHPLNAGFAGKGFEFTDEFFRFHEIYSRDNVRVLFSIDVDKTDMEQGRAYGNCFRDDNDYPLAWVKSHGAGRVYYTTIGHNPYVFWDEMFLEHFLAAIQFALGDLPASTTPSGKLTDAVRAQEKLGFNLAVQFWSFNRFSFNESIEKASQLGLRNIEAYIFGPRAGQRLTNDDKRILFSYLMPAKLRREVRGKLSDAGIRIINCYIGAWPKQEKQCRKIFDFAREMGIETFVSEPDPNRLDMLEKLCSEYEMNLAIHNHAKGESRYWDPAEVLKVCQGRSRRIGACADTGHWMRSGIDPVEGLKTLEGRIISLHLKDLNELGNLRAHDIPWGTGKANVPAVLAELKRQNFRGTIAIEYEYNWDNSMPDIAKCIDFFEQTALELAD